MGRKSRFTIEQKIEAVKEYKKGKRGIAQICNDLGLNKNGASLYKWISQFDAYGESAFYDKPKNNAYSKEFKEEVVQAYLNGDGSYLNLAIKYNIPSYTPIQNWVKMYNSHVNLKDYNPKGEIYMAKPRKTSYQERIEIVRYCIDHNNEYKLAAEFFNVSYSQVYQWVRKYNELGEEGLQDNRGKRKSDESLSETELLRRKVAQLERQLEMKNMENILLKKVKEIERRGYLPRGNKNQNT